MSDDNTPSTPVKTELAANIAVKTKPSKLYAFLRLLRVQQWIKNIFVLAPIIFTAQFTNLYALSQIILAFLLFCVTASSTYIVNDLKDIDADRQHPKKRYSRPLAAGILTTNQAIVLLMICLIFVFGVGLIVPQVLMVLMVYLLLNIAYSYKLKHIPVIDIFVVASGFVLRVYSGALAIHVPVSGWMFITTLCLALYLASIKRLKELQHIEFSRDAPDKTRKVLARYDVELMQRYSEISATCALIFYSFFVITNKQKLIYTIPLVLFGLFRYWYIACSSEQGESPTEALLQDRPLLGVVLLWSLMVLYIYW